MPELQDTIRSIAAITVKWSEDTDDADEDFIFRVAGYFRWYDDLARRVCFSTPF